MGKSRIIGKKVNKDEWKIKVKATKPTELLIFIVGIVKCTYDNLESREEKSKLVDMLLKLASRVCDDYGKEYREEFLTNEKRDNNVQ